MAGPVRKCEEMVGRLKNYKSEELCCALEEVVQCEGAVSPPVALGSAAAHKETRGKGFYCVQES